MGLTLVRNYITESFISAVLIGVINRRIDYKSYNLDSDNIIQKIALKISGLPIDYDLTPHVDKLQQFLVDNDYTNYSTIKGWINTWVENSYYALSIDQYKLVPITQYMNNEQISKFDRYDEIHVDTGSIYFHFSSYDYLLYSYSIPYLGEVDTYPTEVLVLAESYSADFDELPWIDSIKPIDGHYAKISKKFPGQVSFYENEERMKNGRRLCMKPGRYLTKFYPDMDKQLIKSWAAKTANFFELKYADTAETISWVYKNGPDSCMSKPDSQYDGEINPVICYESPDLKLAYIGNDARVSARALVWPEKKRVGRIYGDWDRMIPLLEAAGYDIKDEDDPSEDYYTFEGARLKYIPYDSKGIIFPYIDGTESAYYDGEWMVLGSPKDEELEIYDCQTDCGVIYKKSKVWLVDTQRWVTESWANNNAIYSEYLDGWYEGDTVEIVTMVYARWGEIRKDFDWVPYSYRNDSTWYCGADGNYYINDIEYTEIGDIKVPSQLKAMYMEKYNLKETNEERDVA